MPVVVAKATNSTAMLRRPSAESRSAASSRPGRHPRHRRSGVRRTRAPASWSGPLSTSLVRDVAQPASELRQRSTERSTYVAGFPTTPPALLVERRCCRAFRGPDDARAAPLRAPIAARYGCRDRDTRRSPFRNRVDLQGHFRPSRRKDSAHTRQKTPRLRWHVVTLEQRKVASHTGPTLNTGRSQGGKS